jgi:hypothetical protein
VLISCTQGEHTISDSRLHVSGRPGNGISAVLFEVAKRVMPVLVRLARHD